MICTRCKVLIVQTEQPYYRTKRGAHHAVCPPKPKEAEIQQACTELLELDGWRALRTDPCSDRARGKGFGEKGMADHLYVRYDGMENVLELCDPAPAATEKCIAALAQVLWVEWKRPQGRVSTQQRTWHAAERAKGALTLIAGDDFPASVEGFWSWYGASGLKRKNITLGAAL